MSKSTISTFELFQMFPDAEAARVYMEGKRWPDGAVCPACDEAKRITTRKGGFYRCNACKTDFTESSRCVRRPAYWALWIISTGCITRCGRLWKTHASLQFTGISMGGFFSS